jgi:hypothetical protein
MCQKESRFAALLLIYCNTSSTANVLLLLLLLGAAAATRCFQQWGVLTADTAPVLDQLACLLQQVSARVQQLSSI